METVDTLISARWVIPIEPAACVLERHAVAVRQGRIVAILPVAEAERRYEAAERIVRDSHVLLPGFVNAHSSTPVALPSPPHPASTAWTDPELAGANVELALARMIGSGTTCFADFSLHPDIVARTAATLHMRACVGLPIRAEATSWAADTDEYFGKAADLHDEYRPDPLVGTAFAVGPVADIPDTLLARLRPKVDELELPVAIPLHESAEAVGLSLQRFGCRPVERLNRLDLATPLLVGLHATHMTTTDIELLAGSGAQIVASCRFDLLRRSGRCALTQLREYGVNVGLGTGALPSGDMLEEMAFAALLASPDAPVPDPHDVLRLATLGGAGVLGLADSTGSLVPGKWADLCAIDLAPARTQPVTDVAMQSVHFAGSDQVSDVWVAGRKLLASGHLVGIDLSATLKRITSWQARP